MTQFFGVGGSGNMGGRRKPQLDGDLRKIRSGVEKGVLYFVAMIYIEGENSVKSKALTARRCMTKGDN